MSAMADRIRRARTVAKLSQQTLAELVGVQRAAVTLWESNKGHLPTMGHLIAIATATGVMLEWLGTGRGPVKPDMDAWIPTMVPGDYAQDEAELEALRALRLMPVRSLDHAIGLLKVMAEPYRERSAADGSRSGHVEPRRRNVLSFSRR